MKNHAGSTPKSRLIACGMIAREVLAINAQLGEVYDIKCLPAEFHHFPGKIAPALDRAIIKAREEGFSHILVGYADCGSGGDIDRVCQKHGVERIAGPHCFSFYMSNEAFARAGDEFLTTFFITDFLARHYENFLLKPLGMDRHPELIETYFGNYRHGLYLAQEKNAALEARAKELTEILGLEYQYRFTGFGDLTDALASHP